MCLITKCLWTKIHFSIITINGWSHTRCPGSHTHTFCKRVTSKWPQHVMQRDVKRVAGRMFYSVPSKSLQLFGLWILVHWVISAAASSLSLKPVCSGSSELTLQLPWLCRAAWRSLTALTNVVSGIKTCWWTKWKGKMAQNICKKEMHSPSHWPSQAAVGETLIRSHRLSRTTPMWPWGAGSGAVLWFLSFSDLQYAGGSGAPEPEQQQWWGHTCHHISHQKLEIILFYLLDDKSTAAELSSEMRPPESDQSRTNVSQLCFHWRRTCDCVPLSHVPQQSSKRSADMCT